MGTLRDDALAIVNDGRALVEELGFRRFGSAIVIETIDRPMGAKAAVHTRAAPLIITPRPKITKLSAERALFIKQTLLAKGGSSFSPQYEATAITPKYALGGYTLEELFAPVSTTPTRRALWLLWGADGLGVDVDQATAFRAVPWSEKALRLTYILGLAETK